MIEPRCIHCTQPVALSDPWQTLLQIPVACPHCRGRMLLTYDEEDGDNDRFQFEKYEEPARTTAPIPMRIVCPECHQLHVDEGEFASKPHHTHACQFCGNVWRPAVVCTVGVRFLPGFKNNLIEGSR